MGAGRKDMEPNTPAQAQLNDMVGKVLTPIIDHLNKKEEEETKRAIAREETHKSLHSEETKRWQVVTEGRTEEAKSAHQGRVNETTAIVQSNADVVAQVIEACVLPDAAQERAMEDYLEKVRHCRPLNRPCEPLLSQVGDPEGRQLAHAAAAVFNEQRATNQGLQA